MSLTPIANVLSEFSPSAENMPLPDLNEGSLEGRGVDSKSNLEGQLEESYERGFADGVSKAKKEADESRQSECEFQDAEARLSLIQESIDGLVKEVIAQQKEKSLEIGSMVSGVLKELIEDNGLFVAARKIEESIERELDGRTNTRIQLCGPEPIVSELAERLKLKGFGVDVDHSGVEPASDLEVQVQIDSTLIRSRISEWKQTISELLA